MHAAINMWHDTLCCRTHLYAQCSCREELPEGVAAAAYDSPQRQLAAVAEASFYLYERQLQRERLPELSIQLPAQPQWQQQQGQEQAADGPGSGSKKGELCIRVEYSGGSGGGTTSGLHFWRRYACTDNQVGCCLRGMGRRPHPLRHGMHAGTMRTQRGAALPPLCAGAPGQRLAAMRGHALCGGFFPAGPHLPRRGGGLAAGCVCGHCQAARAADRRAFRRWFNVPRLPARAPHPGAAWLACPL